jgi:hypothetical protein
MSATQCAVRLAGGKEKENSAVLSPMPICKAHRQPARATLDNKFDWGANTSSTGTETILAIRLESVWQLRWDCSRVQ